MTSPSGIKKVKFPDFSLTLRYKKNFPLLDAKSMTLTTLLLWWCPRAVLAEPWSFISRIMLDCLGGRCTKKEQLLSLWVRVGYGVYLTMKNLFSINNYRNTVEPSNSRHPQDRACVSAFGRCLLTGGWKPHGQVSTDKLWPCGCWSL